MNKKTKPSGTERAKRKYRDNLYTAHRYVLYNYWWQFLKIAYEEKRKVNMKKYEDWGKLDEIFSQSFTTWWNKNWKKLFAEKTASDRTSKFIMTTEATNPNSIKLALETYRLKTAFKKLKGEKELTTEIISKVLPKKFKSSAKEMMDKKKYSYTKCDENRFIIDFFFHHFPEDDTLRFEKENKYNNRALKKLHKQAETILDNVCDCKFP